MSVASLQLTSFTLSLLAQSGQSDRTRVEPGSHKKANPWPWVRMWRVTWPRLWRLAGWWFRYWFERVHRQIFLNGSGLIVEHDKFWPNIAGGFVDVSKQFCRLGQAMTAGTAIKVS